MDGFARQQHYRDLYRRRRPGWRPSVELFRDLVGAEPESRLILDLGCGRLGLHGDDTGCAGSAAVVGVDPDLDALLGNTVLRHRVGGSGAALPFAAARFDVVASAWVLEHLDDPAAVFAEVGRVLRPGGRFVFLTPNAWNYNAWMIRAVPQRWHAPLVQRLYGRGPGDAYPVRYRANSAARLRRLLRRAGFTGIDLQLNGDPSYIAFNDALFGVALLLERALALPALRWQRVHILGRARR